MTTTIVRQGAPAHPRRSMTIPTAIPDGTLRCAYYHPRLAPWFGLAVLFAIAILARAAVAAPSDTYDAAHLSSVELERLAFAGRLLGGVRNFQRQPFLLLTDAPDLNGPAVLAALDAVYQWTRRDFPFLLPPRRAVPLIVFASDQEFNAFWRRLGSPSRVSLEAVPQGVAGRTIESVATSHFQEWPEDGLALYVHEASHALLHQMFGIGAGGNWLAEGVATNYEWQVSQPDVHAVRAGLADPGGRMPLETLLNGERVPRERYWQAALVVQWLLDDPLRRVQLPTLFAAMREEGSVDARQLVGRYLGMSVNDVEEAWLTWAHAQYSG